MTQLAQQLPAAVKKLGLDLDKKREKCRDADCRPVRTAADGKLKH